MVEIRKWSCAHDKKYPWKFQISPRMIKNIDGNTKYHPLEFFDKLGIFRMKKRSMEMPNITNWKFFDKLGIFRMEKRSMEMPNITHWNFSINLEFLE